MSARILSIIGGAALAALSAGSAVAADSPAATDAFYAADAINNGNFDKAEQKLRPASYADADDPARLINLATVYVGTGRFAKARHALERVSKLPDESLTVQGGASFSSHRIAATMLRRLPGAR
jgi:Flp pilus assembly protein TadD